MTEGLDKLIRDAIAALIAGQHATAKVYGWNVLSHDLLEWPGLFRVSASVTHGWIVKAANLDAERKTSSRDRVQLDYDVWGFYGFRSGKKADNSDDEFAVIRAKTYNAIKASPRLGFDNDVERHELLQYRQVTTLECGEEWLHFARGFLRVHLCC